MSLRELQLHGQLINQKGQPKSFPPSKRKSQPGQDKQMKWLEPFYFYSQPRSESFTATNCISLHTFGLLRTPYPAASKSHRTHNVKRFKIVLKWPERFPWSGCCPNGLRIEVERKAQPQVPQVVTGERKCQGCCQEGCAGQVLSANYEGTGRNG